MERIADGLLMRLIGKCLRAGVPDGAEYQEPEEGTAQGAILSPILGNIYLHYVMARWFETEVRPRLRGKAILCRYADGMPEQALNVRVKVPPPQLLIQGSRLGAAYVGDRVGEVPPHRPPKVAAEEQAAAKANPQLSLVIRTSGGRPTRRTGKAEMAREEMSESTAQAPPGCQERHVPKVQGLKSGRPVVQAAGAPPMR
jgi:hypothetical protein